MQVAKGLSVQGTILILDGVATNRILLKARLAPACYHVAQADRLAGLERLLRDHQPDVILTAPRLPDGDLAALRDRLAGSGEFASIPVVAVLPGGTPEARRAALRAGADDVLSPTADPALLEARLRSLVRARGLAEDLRLRDGASRALGFAEAQQCFAPAATVALLCEDRGAGARWQARLKPHLSCTLRHHSRRDALSEITQAPVPDLFVIAITGEGGAQGLRLLSDLRSGAATRHAGIVALLEPGDEARAAAALDLGADDLMPNGFEPEELALRIKAQLRRKQAADRARDTVRDGLRAAVTDPLTGLFNRRYALPQLARVAARSAETGRPFAVLLADIDHFKGVNDRHGHPAGDAVLAEVAQRMKAGLRPSDLLARIGGEEFLIVLPDTGPEDARRAAETLRRRIAGSPVRLPGKGALRVTASLGVALAGGGLRSPEQLLDDADRALYAAKTAGRNQVTFGRPAA